MLVPDRAAQKVVWRASGNPGVVVVDGEPVATWKTRKGAGVVVEPLGSCLVDPGVVNDEADRLGALA